MRKVVAAVTEDHWDSSAVSEFHGDAWPEWCSESPKICVVPATDFQKILGGNDYIDE